MDGTQIDQILEKVGHRKRASDGLPKMRTQVKTTQLALDEKLQAKVQHTNTSILEQSTDSIERLKNRNSSIVVHKILPGMSHEAFKTSISVNSQSIAPQFNCVHMMMGADA